MNHFVEISFTFLIFLVFLYHYFLRKKRISSTWPIFGMIFALLTNLHKTHELSVKLLKKYKLTFVFKGPWLTRMNMLITVDPANVHHIMSTNFKNYRKGPKFNEIFEVLGDGIFNSDLKMWEYHRKMAKTFFGHPKFHQLLVKKVEEKIENGLMPVLDHVCNQGIEIDFQNLFARLSFDTSCTIIMDFDPKSLSIDLPNVPPSKAVSDLQEIVLYRYFLPPFIWKFQKWLSIGREKKHKQAWKILDDFIYDCIAIKRSQNLSTNSRSNEADIDLLTLCMLENEKNNETIYKKQYDTKFLRDTILNYFVAGKDPISSALSWFFYLLSENPKMESQIREELEKVMGKTRDFSKNPREFCTKLIYLHASLCEVLRLYPTIVFQHKTPVETDILPSGHKVDPNMKIIFHLYAMARMESIWGADCCEFKPQRWISGQGQIKYEASYKFLAFSTGPRSCVGKDIAFTQLKIIAAAIIRNYRIEVVKGSPVVPSLSVVLHMKYGFKAKVVRAQ